MLPLCVFYLMVGLWQSVLTTDVNGTEAMEWAPFVEGSFDDVALGWNYGQIGFDATPFPLPITSTTVVPSAKPFTDKIDTEIISSKDDGTDQFVTEVDSFRANRVIRAGLFDDTLSSLRDRQSSRSRSSWSSSWANERSSIYYNRYPQYNYGGYNAQPYYGYRPQYNYGYRPQYNYGYQYRPQYRPQQYYGGNRKYYHYG